MPSIATITLSGDPYIDGLLGTYKWGVSTLTYSYPTSASNYGSYPGGEQLSNFEAINGIQQNAVVDALAMYSGVANLQFNFVVESDTLHGDLRFAMSDLPSTAWAYYPNSSQSGGDAWFRNTGGIYDNPVLGNYAYHTFLHEIGHALGLEHPHESGMPVARDSMEYSVMSYRSYIGASTGTGYTPETWGYAQSLMMLDIAAMQQMYGANFTTYSGSTTYTWSPTTGEMFINGVGQGTPGGNKIFRTVWDGGGNDTYNFSNYGTNLKIDLRPGEWTTTSTAQLSLLHWSGTKVAMGNIANALLYNGDVRSLIENAVGGTGQDTIVGNQASNMLDGGSGNDTLTGGIGDDVLIGGADDDTAIFSGRRSDYSVTLQGDGSFLIVDLRPGGTDGSDVVSTVELFKFTDRIYTALELQSSDSVLGKLINGTSGDNIITSTSPNLGYRPTDGDDTINGFGGHDLIDGGDGDDILNGGAGNDTVYGGDGDDLFRISGNEALYDVIRGGETGEILGDTLELLSNIVLAGLNPVMLEMENLKSNNFAILGTTAADVFDLQGLDNIIDVAIVDGTTGNDTLYGSVFGDSLLGGAGSDALYGGQGSDTLIGGAGIDLVDGGDGDDLIRIGSDDRLDIIRGGEGGEVLGDTLELMSNITLAGLDANLLEAEILKANNYGLTGWTSDDTFDLTSFVSITDLAFVDGGAGNDTLVGSAFGESLLGGAGNDQIAGNDGNDTLIGGAGADDISGGNGDDLIRVGGVEGLGDTIAGGGGIDTLELTSAATLAGLDSTMMEVENLRANNYGITGSTSNDVFDFSGFVSVTGLAFVNGGAGHDTLYGSQLADDLRGGAGNDVLIGGDGADILTGDTGNDVFVFTADATGAVTDRIMAFGDFNGNEDVIDLSAVFSGVTTDGFENWKSTYVSQVDYDSVISFGDDKVVLANIRLAALDYADFKFVI